MTITSPQWLRAMECDSQTPLREDTVARTSGVEFQIRTASSILPPVLEGCSEELFSEGWCLSLHRDQEWSRMLVSWRGWKGSQRVLGAHVPSLTEK